MNKEINFEKSLDELEKIAARLESGDISLDDSIKLFERGMELTNKCRKTLENARQKIITLTEAETEKENDGK